MTGPYSTVSCFSAESEAEGLVHSDLFLMRIPIFWRAGESLGVVPSILRGISIESKGVKVPFVALGWKRRQTRRLDRAWRRSVRVDVSLAEKPFGGPPVVKILRCALRLES